MPTLGTLWVMLFGWVGAGRRQNRTTMRARTVAQQQQPAPATEDASIHLHMQPHPRLQFCDGRKKNENGSVKCVCGFMINASGNGMLLWRKDRSYLCLCVYGVWLWCHGRAGLVLGGGRRCPPSPSSPPVSSVQRSPQPANQPASPPTVQCPGAEAEGRPWAGR